MNRVIIDVREPEEYAGGHASGALNVPLSKLMRGPTLVADVAKDAEVILYCRSGNRSEMAMNILRKQGYTNPVNGINQKNVELRYL